MIPQSRLPTTPPELVNMELRGIPEIPAVIAVTEKEAAVCFRIIDGRIDYASFYGCDPLFRAWVSDLFLFFWDKAKRV